MELRRHHWKYRPNGRGADVYDIHVEKANKQQGDQPTVSDDEP
jgi:hypothetical protein